MFRLQKQLLVTGLLLLSLSAQAELAVIDLGYRTAEELIPALGPIMGPDDVLTGTGYQLIVRGNAQTLEEIRQLLEKLDVRPNNLLITVRRQGSGSSSDRGYAAGGEVVITDRGTGVRGQISGRDGRTDRSGYVTQQLRVIEGSRALISAGESTPVRTRQIYRNGQWLTVTENVEYRDTGDSVYVLPRVQGNRVTLEIEPQSSQWSSGNQISVDRIQTTVSGQLGEWISLGQSNEASSSEQRGLLSRGSTEHSNNVSYEVRVEIIE